MRPCRTEAVLWGAAISAPLIFVLGIQAMFSQHPSKFLECFVFASWGFQFIGWVCSVCLLRHHIHWKTRLSALMLILINTWLTGVLALYILSFS